MITIYRAASLSDLKSVRSDFLAVMKPRRQRCGGRGAFLPLLLGLCGGLHSLLLQTASVVPEAVDKDTDEEVDNHVLAGDEQGQVVKHSSPTGVQHRDLHHRGPAFPRNDDEDRVRRLPQGVEAEADGLQLIDFTEQLHPQDGVDEEEHQEEDEQVHSLHAGLSKCKRNFLKAGPCRCELDEAQQPKGTEHRNDGGVSDEELREADHHQREVQAVAEQHFVDRTPAVRCRPTPDEVALQPERRQLEDGLNDEIDAAHRVGNDDDGLQLHGRLIVVRAEHADVHNCGNHVHDGEVSRHHNGAQEFLDPAWL
mmetsp:Transcript_29892/g.53795  ORF Transcript_29892/g.53795 Transcript_29892/m.53795 type:complete len:310 (-) Transcript_29892:373-1302(-)